MKMLLMEHNVNKCHRRLMLINARALGECEYPRMRARAVFVRPCGLLGAATLRELNLGRKGTDMGHHEL